MTIFQLIQCCQAIHGKENYCLAGRKTPFIRHIWPPLFMSSPVCLKIPGHYRHSEKYDGKMKVILKQTCHTCLKQWQHVGNVHSCSREPRERWHFSLKPSVLEHFQ